MLAFCPSRSGYVADVCVDNFWAVCPPALQTTQEIKERDCCLGALSPALGPAKLGWMYLHILRKGFCVKGRGRQARECSSVTTPKPQKLHFVKTLCFPCVLTGMAQTKWQSGLSCQQFVCLSACWQVCSFRCLHLFFASPVFEGFRVGTKWLGWKLISVLSNQHRA